MDDTQAEGVHDNRGRGDGSNRMCGAGRSMP
jgi:hypothetical protein